VIINTTKDVKARKLIQIEFYFWNFGSKFEVLA